MHSEVNLLIQHIIVQDQDGQNNNIVFEVEGHPNGCSSSADSYPL